MLLRSIQLSALILLLLNGCPEEPGPGGGGGPLPGVLSLELSDRPGAYRVGGAPGPYRYDCQESRQGEATVVAGIWLAARDLPDADLHCRLLAEGVEPSDYVRLRPGQLEAQRRHVDPRGDGGLGPWEARALSGELEALLDDPSIDLIAWLDENDRLQIVAETGHLEVHRIWDGGASQHIETVLSGEHPCAAGDPLLDAGDWQGATVAGQGFEGAMDRGYSGNDDERLRVFAVSPGVPACAQRLRALFESPDAPDLLLVPHVSAKEGDNWGRASGLQEPSARVPLLVWGQGLSPEAAPELVEAVDVAASLAASLGLEARLGYAADGALAKRLLTRQDGRQDAWLKAAGSDRALVIVIEGLGLSSWDQARTELPGLSSLVDAGRALEGGMLASVNGASMVTYGEILTGARSGHHGLVGDRLWLRSEKRIQPLRQGIAHGLEGVQEAVLRSPAQSLFTLLMGPDRWQVALGSSPCLGPGTCTASERGPAGDKWRRISSEAAYADLPQPPAWSVGENSGDWEDTVIMTEFMRRLVLGLGQAERPQLLVAGLPGYRLMAEQFGPDSDRAQAMLQAIDSIMAGLVEDLTARQLDEQLTIIVTSDTAINLSDPGRPLPAWWEEGEVVPGLRSVGGSIYVEALSMEREIDSGFVSLRITDADDPDGMLSGLELSLYDGADEVLAQHFPNADGSISFASPNDRETYAIARASGFVPLVIANGELRR